MNGAKEDLIKYRQIRALETLKDAKVVAQGGGWNTCVNRLYYACFYAVSALLTRHGLSSAKHSGVRSLFNRHFVKTGKVSKEMGRIYNDLYERRQEGDYEDFFNFAEDVVRPWIPQTEAFIECIADVLEKESKTA